jgi:hypothetical protein
MKELVTPSLTAAEAEALVLFLAERGELWRLHARGCGVAEPDRVAAVLAAVLAEAHAAAVKRHCKGRRG